MVILRYNFIREVYKTMKKLMCILILIAFFGSTLIMTGCLGGSSGGIGAILAGVLIVSIIASGPTTAVFAANTRLDGNLRAQTVSTSYVARITATGQSPVLVSEVTVKDNDISFSDISINPSSNNQFLVEIFPKDFTATTQPFFKYYFTQAVGASNESHSKTITASDTAKALIYDNWTASATKTIEQADFTAAGVDTIATNINTQLTGLLNAENKIEIPASFLWNSATVSTPAKNAAAAVTEKVVRYRVSGFITAGDGVTGQVDGMVRVFNQADEEIDHTSTNNGNFALDLSDGTYKLVPYKQGHVYTPESSTITVNGADVSGINFQAAPAG